MTSMGEPWERNRRKRKEGRLMESRVNTPNGPNFWHVAVPL